MPEILEAEKARELIEARALGREIATVHAPDAWFLKRGLTPDAAEAALPGHRFTDARRRGKLLLLDTDADGPTLALHLGMSGRVVIDGEAAGDPLLYAANGDNPAWLRFGVTFTDGGSMYLRDPVGWARRSWIPTRSGSASTRSRSGSPRCASRWPRAARRSRRCSWTSRASPVSATCSRTRCCSAPASTRPVRRTR